MNYDLINERADRFKNRLFIKPDKSLLQDTASLFDKRQPKNSFDISYRMFDSAADKTGAMLSAEGIKPGCLVLVSEENPIQLLLVIAGVWKAGATPAVIDPQFTGEYAADICEGLDLGSVYGTPKFLSGFNIRGVNRIESGSLKSATSVKQLKRTTAYPETAIVLFTSGSTGMPKAVPLSFGNFKAAFDSGSSFFNYSEDDKWGLTLPGFHIGGFSIFMRALFSGAGMVIPDSVKHKSIKKLIAEDQPDYISLVPTQLGILIEAGISPPVNMRVLLGGAPAEKKLLLKAGEKGWNIFKVYGSTETAAFVTVLDCSSHTERLDSAGKALDGVEIRIAGERGELRHGEKGEIAIKTDAAAGGYLNFDESKFNGSWYYTGDFGRLDSDGFIYIDRKRVDRIISGGKNIDPIEIENQMMKIEGVGSVCVTGIRDEYWGESLTAVIEGSAELNSEKEIVTFLRRRLPAYKVPKEIIFTTALPRTALGKIDRRAVREKYDE